MRRVLRKRLPRDFKAGFGRYLALILVIAMGIYLVISIVGSAETVLKGTDEKLLSLTLLALCFRRALKNRQFGYRIGGDEFVILCRKVQQAEMTELIERIETSVAETQYTCSLGHSFSADGKKPIEDMLKESDIMMYAMKERFYKEHGQKAVNAKWEGKQKAHESDV